MSACREEKCWEIDGRTGLFGLLGSPVEHSLSPAMHNEAFRLLGINARYLAFDLQKEDLPGALPVFRKMKLQGCNLTMPLKEAVIPLCDSISKEAELAHSVNTLVFRENGEIEGHSTDGKGFFRGLEAKGLALKGKKLSLLGMGGAGKAILSYGIGTELSEIEVLVREESKGKYEDFVERCEKESGRKISLKSLEKDLEESCGSSDILVNASSVGMKENRSLVEDSRWLHKGLFVADCIYHPLETKLLQQAKEQGLSYMNGLPMLFYQGAESFRLWTGKDFPEGEVYTLLESKVKEREG